MHIAILNDVAAELEKRARPSKNKLPLMQLLIIIMVGLKTLSLVWKIRESKRTGESLKLLILSIEDGLEQAYEEKIQRAWLSSLPTLPKKHGAEYQSEFRF